MKTYSALKLSVNAHFNFILLINEIMKESSYKFAEYEKSEKFFNFTNKNTYYTCLIGITDILAQTF